MLQFYRSTLGARVRIQARRIHLLGKKFVRAFLIRAWGYQEMAVQEMAVVHIRLFR